MWMNTKSAKANHLNRLWCQGIDQIPN